MLLPPIEAVAFCRRGHFQSAPNWCDIICQLQNYLFCRFFEISNCKITFYADFLKLPTDQLTSSAQSIKQKTLTLFCQIFFPKIHQVLNTILEIHPWKPSLISFDRSLIEEQDVFRVAGTLSLERSVIHANSPPRPLPCFEREVNVGVQLYNVYSTYLQTHQSIMPLRPDFLLILKIEETYFACDFSLKSPPFKRF